MRDISGKQVTLRKARAKAILHASRSAISKLRKNSLPKKDPLPIAKVAAVQAAKQTSTLIPYCHPLPVDFVDCTFQISGTSITIETEVKCTSRTGVEMEALAAATAAALTLYDMMKAVDPAMTITGIRLLEKRGGKSDFSGHIKGSKSAVVLVLSDSVSRGRTRDTSGRAIVRRLNTAGFKVLEKTVIPDEVQEITAALRRYTDEMSVDLVLTTGGTGLGPRDATPEATSQVIQKPAPGIEEALRSAGARKTPFSILSRGRAGVRGRTLIVNLPGSEAGVNEALDVLLPVLPHALDTMDGSRHTARRQRRS